MNANQAYVSRFFYRGNTVRHRNVVHSAGVHFGIQYTFNPASLRPFSIRGEGGFNWQFANRQLLYDRSKNVFYNAKSLLNTFSVGAQLGVDWECSRYATLGAFVRYDLTAIGKKGTTLDQMHWNAMGIRVSVPIKKGLKAGNIKIYSD